MKNRTWNVLISSLVAAFWVQAYAAPNNGGVKPGWRVLVPPGTWQEVLLGGQPGTVGNEVKAQGDYYTFTGARIVSVTPLLANPPQSPLPEWDYVTIYEGGTLTLKNVKGAPWYQKRGPAAFVYTDVAVKNLTRSTRYVGTAEAGRLDFQLLGIGDEVTISGTYSGMPQVVANDLPTSVTVGAQLDTAKVKVGPNQAGPKPGWRQVIPPGTWQEMLLGGVPGTPGNVVSATGDHYTFGGATLVSVQTFPLGKRGRLPLWDYATVYEGGTLTLQNVPEAPWYNENDPHTQFVFADVEVMNLTRSTRYDKTQPGRLDFELTGAADGMMILGTYSGTPQIVATDLPASVTVGAELDRAKIKTGEFSHRGW